MTAEQIATLHTDSILTDIDLLKVKCDALLAATDNPDLTIQGIELSKTNTGKFTNKKSKKLISAIHSIFEI